MVKTILAKAGNPGAAVLAALLLAGCGAGDRAAGMASALAPLSTGSLAPAAQAFGAPTSAQPLTQAEFLPVVGLPADKAESLARALGETAASRGVAVVAAGDPAARHRLKGYFSAVGEGPSTGVAYVFDVFDARGTLVDRIEGRESVASAPGEPWQGADDDLFRRVAAKTLDGLAQSSALRG